VKISRISATVAAMALATVLSAGSAAASVSPRLAIPRMGDVQPVVAAVAVGGPFEACSATFFDGNSLLGPADLPVRGPVGEELAGYRRTGSMSPASFLARYYDTGAGSWIYPPDNGFVIKPDGQPEETTATLRPGQDIDRYGSEFGGFLAPAGLGYAYRSIPPTNLHSTPAASCNYHDYAVLRAFDVDAGPAAPWFGQLGSGLQYQLDATLVPGAPAPLNVMWLVNNGYLERLP
jgi:Tuberculosis necrotizing toxin